MLAATDFILELQTLFERMFERPWVTAVELALVGGVVYAVLRSVHGTRGARLVRAVLAISALSFAVVWLVAERFELDRINVLYPYFMLAVFLVSLVAFQAELRRLLVRVGEGRWLQRWIRTSDWTIEPIVAAVEKLAKQKIGALIAVQRITELGAICETGVKLDAALSSELLETIFWPGTALHDLGVVVYQGRIVAAGCQFPLAESGDLERSFGSRHRAAVGLSHELDALVIVVSEETGTISVAMGGVLRRPFTADTLRAFLTRELGGQVPETGEASAAIEPPAVEDVATVTLAPTHDGTTQTS